MFKIKLGNSSSSANNLVPDSDLSLEFTDPGIYTFKLYLSCVETNMGVTPNEFQFQLANSGPINFINWAFIGSSPVVTVPNTILNPVSGAENNLEIIEGVIGIASPVKLTLNWGQALNNGGTGPGNTSLSTIATGSYFTAKKISEQ